MRTLFVIMTTPSKLFVTLTILFFASTISHALDAGKANGEDDALMQQTIQSTKQSMDREILDELYRDAEDAYHDGRYDEALELLNKIYSLSPGYKNAAQLRRVISEAASKHTSEADMDTVRENMNAGDEADRSGQHALAVSYWKKALEANPNYVPAQKQIQRVNKILAQKEYDQGYLYYHQNDLENALDAWSNAVALDASYRKKGLLVLMSKIQLDTDRDQGNRLRAQGYDQFQRNDLQAALESFQQLSTLSPRDEEARQMVSKIKIHLGRDALSSAQKALSSHHYAEAGQQADKAIGLGYELALAQKIKKESAHPEPRSAHHPKPAPSTPPTATAQTPAASTTTATGTAATAAAPTGQPPDPEQAMAHYRKGLAAIRTKKYEVAINELDTARALDPSNERIYLASERAHQESAQLNAGPASPGGAP